MVVVVEVGVEEILSLAGGAGLTAWALEATAGQDIQAEVEAIRAQQKKANAVVKVVLNFVSFVRGSFFKRYHEVRKRLIRPTLTVYARWQQAVNSVLEAWYERQINFHLGVLDALGFLVRVRLYDPQTGDIPLLRRGTITLRSDLLGKPDGWIWKLGASLDNFADRMANPSTGRVPILERGLAALRDDLFAPNTGWIRRLGASLDNFADNMVNPRTGRVTVAETRIANLTNALLNLETGRITTLETEFATVSHQQTQTQSYLGPMEDLIPGAALAPFLATMLAISRETGLANPECRARQKDICSANGTAWSLLASALIGGLALELFPILARVTSDVIDQTSGPIHEYAERSLEAYRG